MQQTCHFASGGVWIAAEYGGVFRVFEGSNVTDKAFMNSTGATAVEGIKGATRCDRQKPWEFS